MMERCSEVVASAPGCFAERQDMEVEVAAAASEVAARTLVPLDRETHKRWESPAGEAVAEEMQDREGSETVAAAEAVKRWVAAQESTASAEAPCKVLD